MNTLVYVAACVALVSSEVTLVHEGLGSGSSWGYSLLPSNFPLSWDEARSACEVVPGSMLARVGEGEAVMALGEFLKEVGMTGPVWLANRQTLPEVLEEEQREMKRPGQAMLEEGVRTGDLSVGGDVGVTLRCAIYTVGVGMVHELCSARTVSAALCVQRLSSERPLSKTCPPSPRRPWVLVNRQAGADSSQEAEESSATVTGLQACDLHTHRLGYSSCQPQGGWAPVVCPPETPLPKHRKNPKRFHRGHHNRKGHKAYHGGARGNERPRISKRIDFAFYGANDSKRAKRNSDTVLEDVEGIISHFGKRRGSRMMNNDDMVEGEVPAAFIDEPESQTLTSSDQEITEEEDVTEENRIDLDAKPAAEGESKTANESKENKGPVLTVSSGLIFVHDDLPVPERKDDVETTTDVETSVENAHTENALLVASQEEGQEKEPEGESSSLGIEVPGEAEEQNEAPQMEPEPKDESQHNPGNQAIIFPEDPIPPDSTGVVSSERGMDEGYPINDGKGSSDGSGTSEGVSLSPRSIIFPGNVAPEPTMPDDSTVVEVFAPEESGPQVHQETTMQTVAILPVNRDASTDDETSDGTTNLETNEINSELNATEDPVAEETASEPVMIETPEMTSDDSKNEDPVAKGRAEVIEDDPEETTEKEAAVEEKAETPQVSDTVEKPEEMPAVTDEAQTSPNTQTNTVADENDKPPSSQGGRHPLFSQIIKNLFG